MIFEDALQAMREGKQVKRKEWSINGGICLNEKGKICYCTPFGVGGIFLERHMDSKDITAEDWEILENAQEKRVELCKLNITDDITGGKTLDIAIKLHGTAKRILEEQMLKNFSYGSGSYQTKSKEKEEKTMEWAERIEIAFKNGDTISYGRNEWDDYAYDGKAIAVKKKGAWVGIYNFDNVLCVELKRKTC